MTLGQPLKKIKINLAATLRYLYPAAIILVAVVLVFFLFFLYRNVYQTLSEAEILTALKKEVPTEILEKKKFLEVTKRIREKTSPAKTAVSDDLKNIFRDIGAESIKQ